MQKSWRYDTDKLTFILCMPPPDGAHLPDREAEIASMIGDVNMFVSMHEEDDGKLSLVGELELMIAVKDFQRKGLGRSALLSFLSYILKHEKEIVQQYPGRNAIGSDVGTFDYFAVKINEDNWRSLSLFEAIGFEKTSTFPNFFGEFELRKQGLSNDEIKSMLSKYSVEQYHEVLYDGAKQEKQS